MSLKQFVSRCVRDWFSLDLRSLALFRITISLLILFDLWIRSRDIVAFYTDDGVLPRNAYFNMYDKAWHFSLYFSVSEYSQVLVLFLINAAAAVCMLVGYRTRLMTVVCWALLASLHNRNYLLLNGGDTLFRLLLFWSMFLPLGSRWSIDRARGQREHSDGARTGIASAGMFAFIVQVCLVYWITVVFKARGTTWHDGTALQLALDNPYFTSQTGEWFRHSFELFLPTLTHATFYGEMFGTLFLFSPVWRGPLRTLCVFGFLALHIGILAMMEVGLFPYVSGIAWLALLPSWFWDRCSQRYRNASDPRIAATDTGATKPGTSPGPNSIDTALNTGHPRLARVARATGQFAVLATLAYTVLWNMRAIGNDFAVRTLQHKYNWYGYMLRLDQSWGMFAPDPPTEQGWYVFEITLTNGEKGAYNLLVDREPVGFTRPDAVSETIPNRRWAKYLYRINYSSYDSHRHYFAKYSKKLWNAEHPHNQQAESITALYVRPTKTASGDETIDKIVIWRK